MTKRTLTPLPGKLICKPLEAIVGTGGRLNLDDEQIETRSLGGILVPEAFICPVGDLCTVLSENPRRNDISGLVGEKILVHTGIGTDFEWEGQQLRIVPLFLGAVLAVQYDGVWVEKPTLHGEATTSGEPGVLRCRWCKSKGELNMLIGSGGYCPRCMRYPDGTRWSAPKVVEDQFGNKKTVHTTRLSKEEEELYGGTEDGKPKPKPIISYPGQEKKS